MYANYPDPMPDFQYLDWNTGGNQGKGLLESALGNPSQTFGGRFVYRTVQDKAAILLRSMILDHPFTDGNKRMALATVNVFLMFNGYAFYATTDDAVSMCIDIASGGNKVSFLEVKKWMRSRSISIDRFIQMPTHLR